MISTLVLLRKPWRRWPHLSTLRTRHSETPLASGGVTRVAKGGEVERPKASHATRGLNFTSRRRLLCRSTSALPHVTRKNHTEGTGSRPAFSGKGWQLVCETLWVSVSAPGFRGCGTGAAVTTHQAGPGRGPGRAPPAAGGRARPLAAAADPWVRRCVPQCRLAIICTRNSFV